MRIKFMEFTREFYMEFVRSLDESIVRGSLDIVVETS